MRMRARIRLMRRRLNKYTRRASEELARQRALVWLKLYAVRFWFLSWRQRHDTVATVIVLLALITHSVGVCRTA